MTKKSLNEKEVEEFLLLNPDFLSKNSHILNALEIVHETGGAVSLIMTEDKAIELGMTPLRDAGIEKVISGESTIYEVLRSTVEDI